MNNVNEFHKLILEKKKRINKELLCKYQSLTDMLKKLYNSQDIERNKAHCKYQSMTDMLKKLHNTQDTERNEIQVDLIKSELIDLKNEFGNMNLKMNSQIK